MRTMKTLGLALALAAVALSTPVHAKEAGDTPVSITAVLPEQDSMLKTLDAIEVRLVANVFELSRTAGALGHLVDTKEQRTSPEVLDVADGRTMGRTASSVDRVSAFNLDHLSVAFVSNPSGDSHVSVLERSGKSATSPKVKVHKRRLLTSISIDNRYRGVDHEICSQGVTLFV